MLYVQNRKAELEKESQQSSPKREEQEEDEEEEKREERAAGREVEVEVKEGDEDERLLQEFEDEMADLSVPSSKIEELKEEVQKEFDNIIEEVWVITVTACSCRNQPEDLEGSIFYCVLSPRLSRS